MGNIINNLMDISWWFNNFFPIACVALIPKFSKVFLKKLRVHFRNFEAKFWIKNRHKSFDDLLMQKSMLSSQAAFNVFAIFASVGLLLLLTGNYVRGDKMSVIFIFAIAFPILTSEIVWLVKDGRVEDLIKRRHRWLVAQRKTVRRIAEG